MVVLTIALDQLRFEVGAHFAEDAPEVRDGPLAQDIAPIFRYKDQMNVDGKNDVTSSTKIHVAHRETKRYGWVMDHRGYRFKLVPTAEQASLFRQFAGVTRLVYNLALEQRATWFRHYERSGSGRLNYVAQAHQLTALRAEFDWVRAVYVSCQQQALRDLDRAFVNFFAGRARYPTPRRKGTHDSFRFPGREVECRRLSAKWSTVRLPKIGWVRFRDTRPLGGKVLSATVSLDALGWHVSFACELDRGVPEPSPAAVGIDRGVTVALALSTGEMMTMPSSLETLDRQYRRVQRALARKKRGSNRRKQQIVRCARLSAKRARVRRHFQHRTSLAIAKGFGTAVIEDLNVRGMTASARGTAAQPGRNVRAKAGLNRSILNAGWHGFETLLTYKMKERGGQVVKIPAPYTSQTCAECGRIDSRSRTSQATFRCTGCDHAENADINAARVILGNWRRNTACLDVEGSHRRLDEASTSGASDRSGNPRPSGRGRC